MNIWNLKKNLIIVGPTGCGKTQLSIALGRAACQLSLSVLFVSVQQMFDEANPSERLILKGGSYREKLGLNP